MDNIGFSVGDRVMLLNADEVEIAAGRNIRTDCTWEHSKITELQGSVVTIKSIGDDMDYRRIVRKIIEIETDDGKVIGCHPEWLQLLKSFDEQDTTDLDALFEEFSV